jgi:hypothetical protein
MHKVAQPADLEIGIDSLTPARSVATQPSFRCAEQIPFAVSQTAQVSPSEGEGEGNEKRDPDIFSPSPR